MTQTRKMAYIAILSAVSFLLMYLKFPLIPTASFLEIDFSIIPILVGMLLLDMKAAWAILLIRTVLKFIFNNAGPSTLIGLPMNIVAVGVFVLAMAFLWKKNPTLKNYVFASLVGTLGLTVSMIVLNYIYAVPVYAAFANFDIKQILGLNNYLFGMVLPFNLLEGVLFALVFYIFYIAFRPYLKKI
ncbi:ECF transporter S component [Streptococcus gallolyticus]|uniref:ECF transporter S component n=1 Tax=Streptococcus hepaticus TaxID=3349163 RepID=UPI001C96FAF9|nr:ECF transporter S component [Streptococcus gallolyticus]MBY5040161.1 ECF transporter S component [Streptococcus gallolyticus]